MVSKASREQRKGTWALSRGRLSETSQAVLGLQAGFAALPQRKLFSVPSRRAEQLEVHGNGSTPGPRGVSDFIIRTATT